MRRVINYWNLDPRSLLDFSRGGGLIIYKCNTCCTYIIKKKVQQSVNLIQVQKSSIWFYKSLHLYFTPELLRFLCGFFYIYFKDSCLKLRLSQVKLANKIKKWYLNHKYVSWFTYNQLKRIKIDWDTFYSVTRQTL